MKNYTFTVYRRFFFIFTKIYATFDKITDAKSVAQTLNAINKPTTPYKIGIEYTPSALLEGEN